MALQRPRFSCCRRACRWSCSPQASWRPEAWGLSLQQPAADLPCSESLPAGQVESQRLMLLVNQLPNLLLNSLRNPAPWIVFDSDVLAIPAQAPRLWPEPVELKVSRDLAPKSAAAPFRRGPARDQFEVGRGPGIQADRSTRRRNRRRRARALAKRPAGRVFSAGLAGRTEKPGRLLWLPVAAAPLCPVSNSRGSSFPAAILPVPFSPVPQAPDRRKVFVGARASTLPKQPDLEM